MCWIYLFKEKYEVEQTFKKLFSMIQNQFQAKIQILHTDNEKEYFNLILGQFLSQNGIVHQNSCIDIPQQNSIFKRKNQHLLEVSRSIMLTSIILNFFWGRCYSRCLILN